MEALRDRRLVRSAMRLMVSTMELISPVRLPSSRMTVEDCTIESRTRPKPIIDFCTFLPPSSASRETRRVISSACLTREATDCTVRSIWTALTLAPEAASLIFSALCATPWTERAVSSMAAETCCTEAVRVSVIADTSSMEAAISVMEETISSLEVASDSL
ncbi:MAG: hypothetical protein ACD_75C02207G0005 [uncultured bacterium]|nr:MAG: hypothetical protein ACD_75C02207G0005 [uncultured bacterium]